MTAVLEPVAYLAPLESLALFAPPLRRSRVEAELAKLRASGLKRRPFRPIKNRDWSSATWSVRGKPYRLNKDGSVDCGPAEIAIAIKADPLLFECDLGGSVGLGGVLERAGIDPDAGKKPGRELEGGCRLEGCDNLPVPQRRRCSACQTWISRNRANDTIREAWLADQAKRTMLPQTEPRRPKWEALTAAPDKYADEQRRRPSAHRHRGTVGQRMYGGQDATPQPIPLWSPLYPPVSVYVRADSEKPGEPGCRLEGLPAVNYAEIVWNDMHVIHGPNK
jgi:hypothetical protein